MLQHDCQRGMSPHVSFPGKRAPTLPGIRVFQARERQPTEPRGLQHVSAAKRILCMAYSYTPHLWVTHPRPLSQGWPVCYLRPVPQSTSCDLLPPPTPAPLSPPVLTSCWPGRGPGPRPSTADHRHHPLTSVHRSRRRTLPSTDSLNNRPGQRLLWPPHAAERCLEEIVERLETNITRAVTH